MATIEPDIAEELVGLPAAIDKALRAHCKPVEQAGMIVCSDSGCDWQRPVGINVKRAYHKHQVWAVHMSVRDWYIEGY